MPRQTNDILERIEYQTADLRNLSEKKLLDITGKGLQRTDLNAWNNNSSSEGAQMADNFFTMFFQKPLKSVSLKERPLVSFVLTKSATEPWSNCVQEILSTQKSVEDEESLKSFEMN